MSNYKTLDSWSLKAKKEGYPARSVYKLQEIDEKFNLFTRKRSHDKIFRVLDLGAAPGSWSLFMLRKMQKNIFLAACDLSDLSTEYGKEYFNSQNVFFLKGDMENSENYAALCERGPFNLVVSDAAPATSGNRLLDSSGSLCLAETSLRYAEQSLEKGGSWVTKIFQGEETADFLKKIKPLFDKTQTFKPKACRANSFEMYIIGLGKL
ncbi:MAG: RlmE family RNA methyltransferase [Spirochaetaceae bacterium]|jgi:23S rRNA (uridine2552-2'-O)-methyltransferase|nr:RlmE family RNA methyltransferase [Spirochaetaceae bacterium]